MPLSAPKSHILVLVTVALIGAALCAAAFQFANRASREAELQAFRDDATEWVYALEAELQSASDAVKSIGDLFAASNEVDREEFRKFVDRALDETAALQALEWLPRIPPEGVAALVSSVQQEGIRDYRIHSVSGESPVPPGHGFDAHFPVHFVEPLRSNRVALGADLTTEPVRAHAMHQAIKSGKFSLTAGLKLIQEGAGSTGLLGFWPILEYGNRPRVLHGFALGVWRLDALVDAATRNVRHDTTVWDISLFDVTENQSGSVLYARSNRTNIATAPEYERSISIGGRVWRVLIRKNNINTAVAGEAWVALAVCLAFTCLLLIYLAAILNRQRTITRLVDERTNALNQALAEVEQTAEQREAARAELARKADALAASNADLEQFAYIASHDLKEPLRTIASYIQLIQRDLQGKLNEESTQYMKFILDGAARMQQLIEDLLSYSKVGGGELNVTEFPAESLATGSIESLTDLIERNQAEILIGDLPVIKGDRSLLGLLMQNLIANAIKFRSKDTNPVIHVGAKRDDGCWHFSVRDNGIGIDSKNQRTVFNLFQRVHTRQEYEGTGLGLAICQRIIHRHGGTLWVNSELGKGSTFTFSIPDQIPGGS